MNKLDNSNISVHLGQTSQYKSQYDPKLLVREPRENNRKHLKLKDHNLPFVGYDTWNAYEISALTNDGLPVTGVAKIVYPCSSKYIVESKSIKLYFNSFNMTKLGNSAGQVLDSIAATASKDLSDYLETTVKVCVLNNALCLDTDGAEASNEWGHVKEHFTNQSYTTLEDEYNLDGVVFNVYEETPKLLEVVESVFDTVRYHSALLKSNCRVTSQPDWGDVYIHIKKEGQTIDPVSLLKYIVSFRDECHFHEEICETIYKRIWDKLNPDELHVMCLYARRGGIDINPQRASHDHLLHKGLMDHKRLHIKTPKQ
jgi:7-cyano-7-deazaguanine reductase